MQLIEGACGDAQPLQRVDVQRQERKDHWQLDTPNQNLEDKPWKNESLQD